MADDGPRVYFTEIKSCRLCPNKKAIQRGLLGKEIDHYECSFSGMKISDIDVIPETCPLMPKATLGEILIAAGITRL